MLYSAGVSSGLSGRVIIILDNHLGDHLGNHLNDHRSEIEADGEETQHKYNNE